MNGFSISTDKSKVDLEKLHVFLSQESYWSKKIPFTVLKEAINNSMTFSVLSPTQEFVGFARLVTDKATFAYLADVYVENDYRGKGLGKFLMNFIMNHTDVKKIRTWLLFTKDAQELYKKFGWECITDGNIVMAIKHNAEEFYSNF